MLCTECSREVQPVVAIDIDGTLGDYHGHFIRFAEMYLNRHSNSANHYGGDGGFKEWAMDGWGIDERTWHDIKLAYRQGGMKRSMPVFEGATELCVSVRRAGAELWLTTTRPFLRLDNVDPDTRFWLDQHGIEYDGLLYDEYKYQRLAELVDPERVVGVVDDLGEMVRSAAKLFAKGVPILKRGPYNSAIEFPLAERRLDEVQLTFDVEDQRLEVGAPVITVITGASSGIGRALMTQLDGDIIGVSPTGPDFDVDVTDMEAVMALAESMARRWQAVHRIVNCAGINYLASVAGMDMGRAKHVMDVNLWGAVNMTRAFLPELIETKGTVCNIVSNAAHVPMTHSLAYNASKAALEMATRQMAHELTPEYGITVFGVSPSKVAGTAMSAYIDEVVPQLRGWTKAEAREYQRKALLTGEELDVKDVAEFIGGLLRHNPKPLTGTVVPYGR